MLPHVDDDGDEEMEIDEEAVENPRIPVEKQAAASEDSAITDLSKVERDVSDSQLVHSELRSSNDPLHCTSGGECTKEQDSEDKDVKMEEGISEQDEAMIVNYDESVVENTDVSNGNLRNSHDDPKDNDQETGFLDQNTSRVSPVDNNTLSSSSDKMLNEEPESKTVKDDHYSFSEEPTPVEEKCNESPNRSMNFASSSLTIVPCEVSPVLKSPTPSISPKTNSSRKSLRSSSMLTASQKNPMDKIGLIQEAGKNSFAKSVKGSSFNALSTQTSKSFLGPTEHLAASIRHGLEIIDTHQQSSAFRRSAFRFSYKPAESKIVSPFSKVDIGIQTSHDIQPEESLQFTCSSCKSKMQLETKEVNGSSDLQLVPADGLEDTDKLKIQVPKVSSVASAHILGIYILAKIYNIFCFSGFNLLHRLWKRSWQGLSGEKWP